MLIQRNGLVFFSAVNREDLVNLAAKKAFFLLLGILKNFHDRLKAVCYCCETRDNVVGTSKTFVMGYILIFKSFRLNVLGEY